MTDYLEAPQELTSFRYPPVFIAGGISGCPDWQHEFWLKIEGLDITFINPRRENYPDREDAARQQIYWEHRYLRRADALVFWFPEETLCPITLFELGSWLMTNKPIILGVHPGYRRRLDIEVQTQLVRPRQQIFYDLDAVARELAMGRLMGRGNAMVKP